MGEVVSITAQVEQPAIVQVRFSAVEDVRRLIFCELGELQGRNVTALVQSRIASQMAAKLRDAGLLVQSLEQHYGAQEVGALCGGRSMDWAVMHAKAGHFGPVSFDGRWLIPGSGVRDYLSRHQVGGVS